MTLLTALIALALLAAISIAITAISKARASLTLHARLERRLDQLAQQFGQSQLRLLQLEADSQTERQAPHVSDAASPASIIEDTVKDASMVEGKPDRPVASEVYQRTAEQTREPEPRVDVHEAAANAQQQADTLKALRTARQRVNQGRQTDPDVRGAKPEPAGASLPSAPRPNAPQRGIKPRLSFEELLAGKVFVWIGAIALVLTAAFLLKLGFDRGIITEPVRVIGAGVFGLLLWCVGEWMRSRVPLISQALCGAAVAVLYATVLAGHSLYGLFGTHWAFAMMAAITAVAVVLSLRHGPWVALLGMVGGFMLPPVLAGTLSAPTLGMVVYLLALEIGIVAVTGRRGWFGLSTVALVFAIAWSLIYTFVGEDPSARLLTAALIIGSAMVYVLNHARAHHNSANNKHGALYALGLSLAGVASAGTVVALLVATGGFAPRDLALLGVVAAGTLVLARRDPRYLSMPFVLMGLGALVIVAGASSTFLQTTAHSSALIWTAAAYGGLFMLGGYASLWASPHARRFALLVVLAGPVYLTAAILAGQATFGWREAWWPISLALAGVYAIGLIPLLRRRRVIYDWPIAAFALVCFALVCISIVQGLHHPRIAICLALVSAVAALADKQLFIRPLLIAAWVVSGIAALLLLVPGPFIVAIQGIAVFNTLLPMYALPALGFGVTAWCAHHAGEHHHARTMTWLSTATVGALLLVQTRQLFQPTDFSARAFDLYESSAYACALMIAGLVGLSIASQFKQSAIAQASTCIAVGGAAIGFLGGLVASNPLFHPQAMGGRALALGLVTLYLLPAWLMALWARRRVLMDRPMIPQVLRVGSIILIAVFAGLQIRNLFHPDALQSAPIGLFECATYALVWMLLGVLIQFMGWISLGPPITRIAGRFVFATGLITALVGNVVILNPLWSDASVGRTPVFNGLWYLFVPAMIALAVLASRYRRLRRSAAAQYAGYATLAIGFLLLSLLIRQGFSIDGVLHLNSAAGSAERYTYSLAWVLFGGALLVAGVMTRLNTLRYGSLAILLLAVGKVFLIDTASLDNLYRVFSFFGLGVTLIGLGYLYQRLVFRRSAQQESEFLPA